MSIRNSISKRRALVILNYLCLFALIAALYTGETRGDSTFIVAVVIGAALLYLLSLVFLYARTQLWWMTHTKIDNLDERQQAITHSSLRRAYGIYTVLSLALLLVIILAARASGRGYDPNLIAAFAALLYLAHTLPGAILAWREKEV